MRIFFPKKGFVLKTKGQVMLLTVLSIGGTILGASTIAGLLMVYQIRSATDFTNSAKAIFAADTGIEWAQYNYFNPTSSAELSLPLFSNGSSVLVTCYDVNDIVLSSCGAIGGATTSNASYAIAQGTTPNTKRAFYLSL